MGRALTICQPYPELILRGEKRVENREWSTNYRGPFLIHAGKSRAWLDEDDEEEYGPLTFGAIVGRADLIDCLHIAEIRAGTHDAKYPWLREHDHTHGKWCWILDNVKRAPTPIPCKGSQGWWKYEPTPTPIIAPSGREEE